MKLMSNGQICIHELIKQFSRPLECNNDRTTRTVLPDMPDKFTCCWNNCPSVFQESDPFFDHVTSHISDGVSKNPEGRMVAKCGWTDCQYESKSRAQLKVHLRKHTLEKEIACPVCGFMFTDKQKFTDHILRQVKMSPEDQDNDSEGTPVAKKGKTEQCDVCKQMFLTSRLRDEHRRIHCSTYQCELCDFLTRSSDALVKHVTYRHSDKRPFPCQFCDSTFKFKRDLRKHLFIHNSENCFQCPECSFSARTVDTLRHHSRKMHQNEDRVFACHICDTECSRGNNLSRHLTVVHGLTPPRGMVRFKYSQDPGDGIYRMVDSHFGEVTSGPTE